MDLSVLSWQAPSQDKTCFTPSYLVLQTPFKQFFMCNVKPGRQKDTTGTWKILCGVNIKQHVELKQKVYFDKHSLMAFQNTIILKAPKWYFLSVLYSWRGPTSGLTRCLKHACSPFQMPDMIDCRANSKLPSVKLQFFRFSPKLCEMFINFYSLKEH